MYVGCDDDIEVLHHHFLDFVGTDFESSAVGIDLIGFREGTLAVRFDGIHLMAYLIEVGAASAASLLTPLLPVGAQGGQCVRRQVIEIRTGLEKGTGFVPSRERDSGHGLQGGDGLQLLHDLIRLGDGTGDVDDLLPVGLGEFERSGKGGDGLTGTGSRFDHDMLPRFQSGADIFDDIQLHLPRFVRKIRGGRIDLGDDFGTVALRRGAPVLDGTVERHSAGRTAGHSGEGHRTAVRTEPCLHKTASDDFVNPAFRVSLPITVAVS